MEKNALVGYEFVVAYGTTIRRKIAHRGHNILHCDGDGVG